MEKMMQRSFVLAVSDAQKLEKLAGTWGCSENAAMRRLVREASL